jgi:hypothetical protein
LRLLGLSGDEAHSVRDRMLAHDKRDMPGLIRISFGLYNNLDEVDRFAEALERVTRGEFSGRYHQETATGEFLPEGWAPDFEAYMQGMGRLVSA